jgi:hypothetical protein
MTIDVTHANIPDTRIAVVIAQIFYTYYSSAAKCTHIVSTGGAFIPVRESVDDITRLLSINAKHPNKEGN